MISPSSYRKAHLNTENWQHPVECYNLRLFIKFTVIFLYLYRPSPHCLQSIIYPQLAELRLISSSTLVYSQAMVMFSLHTSNTYSVINLCLNGLDLLLFLIVNELIKLTRMICNAAYFIDDMCMLCSIDPGRGSYFLVHSILRTIPIPIRTRGHCLYNDSIHWKCFKQDPLIRLDWSLPSCVAIYRSGSKDQHAFNLIELRKQFGA